jgi:hypothetical protein
MRGDCKQTKTHSEKQNEVLELENTLFSTKNVCKALGLWYGPLIFWMAHWNFKEGAMGQFSKNLSLSLMLIN